MKINKYVFLILLTLAGCQYVEFQNGEIPLDYVEMVKQYEGEYKGSFEGQKGSLTLQLEGQRPILKFTTIDGQTDILGGTCNSKIGVIAGANIKEKNKKVQLDRSHFIFDPGSCQIEGRELLVSPRIVKGTVILKVQILKETIKYYEYCAPQESGCVGGIQTRNIYLDGKFSK